MQVSYKHIHMRKEGRGLEGEVYGWWSDLAFHTQQLKFKYGQLCGNLLRMTDRTDASRTHNVEIIRNDTWKVFEVMKSLMCPTQKTGSYPESSQRLPRGLNQSGGPVTCVIEKSFWWPCRERMNWGDMRLFRMASEMQGPQRQRLSRV